MSGDSPTDQGHSLLGNPKARPWNTVTKGGGPEDELLDVLASGEQELSRETDESVDGLSRRIREVLPVKRLAETARKLHREGNLIEDAAAYVLGYLISSYEHRMTELVRERGTVACQHVRHLEIGFSRDGFATAKAVIGERQRQLAAERLTRAVWEYLAPELEEGEEDGSDEGVWQMAAEWLYSYWMLSRTQEALEQRSESEAGEQPSGRGQAEAVAELVPEDLEARLTDPGTEHYRALAQVLARRYLAALQTPAEDMKDGEIEALIGVNNASRPEALPALRTTEDHYEILNASIYHELRRILAEGRFGKVEGAPWPAVEINKREAIGHAIMRPPKADSPSALGPDEVDYWVGEMWRQAERLSDLDADVLDALTAAWIVRSPSHPEGLARLDVDEILDLRELGHKKNASGSGRGHHPDQRRRIVEVVAHLENIYLDMGVMTVPKTASNGRIKWQKERTHSRAIAIVDVHDSPQPRLDGAALPVGFTYRPGEVFGHFLKDKGRQVALMAARALTYHERNEVWEKRLTRGLTFRWRAGAKRPQGYLRPYRVEQLLRLYTDDLQGLLEQYKPNALRKRLEKALDKLEEDGVIAYWEYTPETFVDPLNSPRKGRTERWLSSTIVLEPPDAVKDFLDRVEEGVPEKKKGVPQQHGENTGALHERLRSWRSAKGLPQRVVADRLEISTTHYCNIERGKKHPGAQLSEAIEGLLES